MTLQITYTLVRKIEGNLNEVLAHSERMGPPQVALQDVTALIRNLLFIIEASRELAGMATVTRCQLDAASILNQLEG